MKILNYSTLVVATILTFLLASAQFVFADDSGTSEVTGSDSTSMSSESNAAGNATPGQDANPNSSFAVSDFTTKIENGTRTRTDTSKGMGGPLDNSVTGFPAAATEGGEFGYGDAASDTRSKGSGTGPATGKPVLEGSTTENRSESAERDASKNGSNSERETVNSIKVEKVAADRSLPTEAIVIPVPRSDRRKDQDEALEAVSNGTALPLKNVLREITDGDLGKVIDVKMKETLLGIVYNVKIRTERGEIKNLAVDGKTGKIIGRVGY